MAYPKSPVFVVNRLVAGPGPPWYPSSVLAWSAGPFLEAKGRQMASAAGPPPNGALTSKSADRPANRGAP